MARIIRTTPKTRKKTTFRLAFCFLLVMQIQLPNAQEPVKAKLPDLSFFTSAQTAPKLSLNQAEAAPALNLEQPAAN